MQSKANTMTLLVQNILTDVFHNLEDLDNDITVEDLKCLIEIESQIPVHEQALFFRDKELNQDLAKLETFGITNNDMITLTKKSHTQQRQLAQLNQSDQSLLDGFFAQVSQQISTQPKLTFNQMFNQAFHH